MAILSIEDLISKKDECEKRKEIKYINIHSAFLGGEIRFHSLEKDDILDFRTMAKSDGERAFNTFIYKSSDDLRNPKLLKAYGRDKFDQHKIVEDLFNTEAERARVFEILSKLNGLDGLSPEEIYQKEVENVKN